MAVDSISGVSSLCYDCRMSWLALTILIAHQDGAYETPDKTELSFYTLHLYLNESDPVGPGGELVGGSTAFHSWNMKQEFRVVPKIGRVLIFQHRDLLHSGEEVENGIKLTLRTDLMYRRFETPSPEYFQNK